MIKIKINKYNNKNFKSRARELLIDCGLFQFRVHKDSDYGILKERTSLLQFWFDILDFSREKLQFSSDDCRFRTGSYNNKINIHVFNFEIPSKPAYGLVRFLKQQNKKQFNIGKEVDLS